MMNNLIRRAYCPDKSEMDVDIKWLGVAYKNYLYAIACDDIRERRRGNVVKNND